MRSEGMEGIQAFLKITVKKMKVKRMHQLECGDYLRQVVLTMVLLRSRKRMTSSHKV